MIETLSSLNQDILTVLLGRELYGLQILELLNRSRPTPLGAGSIYPSLNRLEEKGYIDSRKGDLHRKYYAVTDLGASILYGVQQYRSALSRRGK